MGLSKTILWTCLLLVSEPTLAGRTDWRQMTVGNFHFYNTLHDSRTRDVARQLQAFEKTVGEFLQSEARLPDVPAIIFILDGGDFLRYRQATPGLPVISTSAPTPM